MINRGAIIYDGPLEKIKEKYVKYKLMNIKFSEKVGAIKIKGCKILHKDKYNINLKVPLKKQKVQETVDHFLKNYKVADIEISRPSVEDIIKEMYKK